MSRATPTPDAPPARLVPPAGRGRGAVRERAGARCGRRLITEFAGYQQPGRLIVERVVDTLVGALAGLAAAVAVTNRRAGDRVGHAPTGVERAREHAARLLGEPHPAPGALEAARRRLAATLLELRGTVEAAPGEWWQRALPHERVVRAEQSGHRTLAATVRCQGLHLDRHTDTTEGVRP